MAVMELRSHADAFAWQARHAEENGAPATARIVRALERLMTSETTTGRRIAQWPGMLLEDAMPLRLAGGFHHLHLTGVERRLGPVYRGDVSDQAAVDAIVLAVTCDHDATLLGWLDGPPQTNEAGRSASIVAALLWLSERLWPRFELNEIGASAGANTMIERYAYDLGGVGVGSPDSPVLIRPEWRGSPPPAGRIEITDIAGCDRAPIDLSDPAQAMRLTAYCWPENSERLERLRGVIALAHERAPDVVQCDAPDWVEARLARPQESGVTRVLYHSIVWQYIAPEGRARIEAAMDQAGRAAGADKPLAWVRLETNRQTFRHELTVRYWPGGEEAVLLGEAQAHGAWIHWF